MEGTLINACPIWGAASRTWIVAPAAYHPKTVPRQIEQTAPGSISAILTGTADTKFVGDCRRLQKGCRPAVGRGICQSGLYGSTRTWTHVHADTIPACSTVRQLVSAVSRSSRRTLTDSYEARLYGLRSRGEFVEIVVLVRGISILQPGYSDHEGAEEEANAQDNAVAGSLRKDRNSRHVSVCAGIGQRWLRRCGWSRRRAEASESLWHDQLPVSTGTVPAPLISCATRSYR